VLVRTRLIRSLHVLGLRENLDGSADSDGSKQWQALVLGRRVTQPDPSALPIEWLNEARFYQRLKVLAQETVPLRNFEDALFMIEYDAREQQVN